ncbi:uncharacterized protein [Nicotiana sylvestris]|uniref:uncharacterized protein n=1 Tax=Nicotiana sylvestris TaxID=4096 RepID=UPI00388C8788
MTILENEMNKSSGCWTDEDTSYEENENCFMARGETSEVRSYNCERCNELQNILDLNLKESQKIMNELKRLTKEVKDWKLKHKVCEIEKEVLQEEFEELQMQLNGMLKSTSHSSIRSNQTTYKSTGKGPARTKSTSTNTNERPKSGSEVTCHYCNKSRHKYSFCHFCKATISGWEHHRISRKGKWYLDSACSSHMTGDKNLFKEVTKIDGGSVKFGDDSKGKIIGYEVNFKKTGCAIEDESGKIVLPGKRKLGHASMHLIEKLSKHELVDEALRNFEVFYKKVEREKGYLISTIQSDHGKEFKSRAFEDFCNDQGYTHNFSASRSPQQNGVVERKNRTLQDMARTMLLDHSLPNHFWAEGVSTTCHILNRCLIRPILKKTPYELWKESTGEIGSNVPDQPIESTANVVRPNEWRSETEYPQKFIIGDPNEGMKTRGALKKKANIALISQVEPKKIEEALKDSSWVQAMQQELDQFSKNQEWNLIPKLENVSVIGTK